MKLTNSAFATLLATCVATLHAESDTDERGLLVEKVVGGKPAPDGGYPSYAIPRIGLFGSGLCGSVKIWDDILLSAGHCLGVFNGNDMFIGGNLLSGDDAPETIRAVGERRHPLYNDVTVEYDFLLIKLAQPSTAPNAPWNDDPSVPNDGDTVTVIGFGTTSQGGSVSNELLEVDIAVSNYDSCNSIYSGGISDATMICGYGDNADSCQGDR